MVVAFRDGMFHFRGFEQFSRGIKINEFREYAFDITSLENPVTQAAEYRRFLDQHKDDFKNSDLAFVLLPSSNRYATDAPYSAAKVFFSKLGIPTQMIGADRVQDDRDFKWMLSNFALACYAKLGNIPWVIEDRGNTNDLIIGFGKRDFREERWGPIRRHFGFTTAYRNNGSFVTFQGLSPTRTESDMGELLQEAITVALRKYALQQKKLGLSNLVPDRVVLHSFKRVGTTEVDAVKNATQYVEQATNHSIEYVLVHIEESESLYMFDTGDRTYLPKAGQVVDLSRRQALLLTEGRERFQKRKMGFPHPYRIILDERSKFETVDTGDMLQTIIRQILWLSKVNWRGLNAAAIPVTLNYSQLLAEVAGFCQNEEEWQAIVKQEKLQDKAWFL